MSKKLIKTLSAIACSTGILSSVGLSVVSASSCSAKQVTGLEIRVSLPDVTEFYVDEEVTTEILSDNVYNNLGERITETSKLTFIFEGDLPAGLTFNNITGEIFGQIQHNAEIRDYSFCISVKYQLSKEKILYGKTKNLIFTVKDINPENLKIKTPISNYTTKIGQQISTPNLTNLVYTDTERKVTENLKFKLGAALPSGLNFSSSTGVISGAINKNITTDKYVVYIKLSGRYLDKDLTGQTNQFTFTINPSSLDIEQTITGGNARIGETFGTEVLNDSIYTDTKQKVTSDVSSDIAYTLVGNLPTGLEINPDTGGVEGTISNSAAEGDYSFSIKVTATVDGIKLQGQTNQVTLTVLEEVPSHISVNYSFPTYQVECGSDISTEDLSKHLKTNTGKTGFTNLEFTPIGLKPSWLRVNKSTGVLAGTCPENEDPHTLELHLSVTGTYKNWSLNGSSDKFKIVIKEKTVTSIGLDSELPNVVVDKSKEGPTITEDLTDHICTDTKRKVTVTPNSLSCDSTLPEGTKFDKSTGQLTIPHTDTLSGSYSVKIKFTETYGGKTFNGETNEFKIIFDKLDDLPIDDFSQTTWSESGVVGEIDPEKLAELEALTGYTGITLPSPEGTTQWFMNDSLPTWCKTLELPEQIDSCINYIGGGGDSHRTTFPGQLEKLIFNAENIKIYSDDQSTNVWSDLTNLQYLVFNNVKSIDFPYGWSQQYTMENIGKDVVGQCSVVFGTKVSSTTRETIFNELVNKYGLDSTKWTYNK